MTNIEIGNRIKYARDIRGITLDEIAKKVGVAKSTIQRYENGKIFSIKLPVIESIANALTVNPAWLIGKSNDMEIVQKPTPTIMNYFNQLNDYGKSEATKRVKELTCLSQYTYIDVYSLKKIIKKQIAQRWKKNHRYYSARRFFYLPPRDRKLIPIIKNSHFHTKNNNN